jgi:hypothetical protein
MLLVCHMLQPPAEYLAKLIIPMRMKGEKKAEFSGISEIVS